MPVRARQRRLAVIDVARGAEGQGSVRHAGARSAACTPRRRTRLDLGHRAWVEQHRALVARATTGGSPRRSRSQSVWRRRAASTATTGPSSSSSGSEPPPARPDGSRSAPCSPPAPPPRSRVDPHRALEQVLLAAASIPGPAPPRPRRPVRGAGAASPRARPARACRSAPRAPADGAHALDRGAPCQRRCRPAGPPSSLSPEKHTTSAPAATLSAAAGSSRQRASRPGMRDSTPGADVVDHREPAARGQLAQLRSGTSSVKPTVRKLEGCTRISAAVSAPIARS